MREITFTCDDWMGEYLDRKAKDANSTRSEAIRQIVSHHMMAQTIIDLTQAAREAMGEHDDE